MIRALQLFRAEQSSRLGTERDAAGRVWCQLFPLGTWHRQDFPGGRLELTPGLLEEFISNWRAGGSPPLPVDYNHEEDGPAAGWIEDLRLSVAGELEGAIKWTDEAAQDIKADKRRYLSPTWAMAHINRRTGEKGGPWLYGAALLNDPFYDSMPRVAASAANAATSPTHQPTEALAGQEKRMDKKRICAALGLPEDCGDEEVMTAIEAKCKATAALPEVEGKLTAAVRVSGELDAKLKASEDELTKLRAERLQEQVDAAILAGKGEGKALDGLADTIKMLASTGGIDAVKKLIAGVQPTVPLKTSGVAGEKPADSTSARAKYDALIAEKVKAGAKYVDAARAVALEHRDLAALVFPSTNTTAS